MMSPMTDIRQAAEALVEKVKSELPDIWLGGRQNMVLIEQIEAFAKAQRAEECLAIAKHVNEGDVLETPDELDARCKCQCFGVLGRIGNWLDARSKEWRG